jgi:predicted transcriptional regulator
MMRKEIAIKAGQDLADSAAWAGIDERIRFLGGIGKGLADIEAGRVVPHEQVREELMGGGAIWRGNLRVGQPGK